jgi:hypothetical protein
MSFIYINTFINSSVIIVIINEKFRVQTNRNVCGKDKNLVFRSNHKATKVRVLGPIFFYVFYYFFGYYHCKLILYWQPIKIVQSSM